MIIIFNTPQNTKKGDETEVNKQKLNNKGFTLIETTVCFILLGILLVAAAQVIASSTEVYYYSKSISYGIQASQVVATEIRGDLEEAVIKQLDYVVDNSIPVEASGKCIHIGSDKKSIYFINGNGERVGYSLKPDGSGNDSELILFRDALKIYDDYFDEPVTGGYTDTKKYTSQYIGMGYKVKDISFSVFDKSANIPSDSVGVIAGAGDFPVIVLNLTVTNPQYGDYICTEYIALYNFYGAASFVNN